MSQVQSAINRTNATNDESNTLAANRKSSGGKPSMVAVQEVAPGVACLPVVFVNAYFIGEPGKPWVLVDTGLNGFAWRVKQAARARYGDDARPEAILLTHGHFDHAGGAIQLAKEWDVPVFAHELEMPFLTGKDFYPPPDPTVGGFLAFLSRFFPNSGIDLGSRVRVLSADGTLPALPEWKWIHTPGHTTGHTSFYREADRVLIAGDALTTVNMDSAFATLAKTQSINTPPPPVTGDWAASQRTVEHLASLRPRTLACGHGAPMSDEDSTQGSVAAELQSFAARFDSEKPAHGRYVNEPAVTDESGIVHLPPPAPDPAKKVFVGIGLAAIGAAAVVAVAKRQPKQTRRRSHKARRDTSLNARR